MTSTHVPEKETDENELQDGANDSESVEETDENELQEAVTELLSDKEKDGSMLKEKTTSITDKETDENEKQEGVNDSVSDEEKDDSMLNEKMDSIPDKEIDENKVQEGIEDSTSDKEKDDSMLNEKMASIPDKETDENEQQDGVKDLVSDEEKDDSMLNEKMASIPDKETDENKLQEGVKDSASDKETDDNWLQEGTDDLVKNEETDEIELKEGVTDLLPDADDNKLQEGVTDLLSDEETDDCKLKEKMMLITDKGTDDNELQEGLVDSVSDEETDDSKLKEKAMSIPEKGDDKNSVVGYHKMTDTAINFNDVKVHCQYGFDRSIGILRVNGSHSNSHGTCFRVGNQRHVITAYHVVGDAINYMIQEIANHIQYSSKDPDLVIKVAEVLGVNKCDRKGTKVVDILRFHFKNNLSEINISNLLSQLQPVISKDEYKKILERLTYKLWKKACTVKFEEESTIHSFEYDIPFVDKINDIAILKVSGKDNLPKAVLLDSSDPHGQVMVFGYPGTDQLKIDIGCPVYSRKEDLDKDINKNVEFWMKHYPRRNRDFFVKGYKDKTENKTILHTSKSFVFGASGGPMTKVDRISNTPFVFMMYQGGIPHFYYEQGHPLYMYRSAPEDVRFEVGISMKNVAHLLECSGKTELQQEIFENVRYSNDES